MIKLNKKKVKSSFKVKINDKIEFFNFDFKENIVQKKNKFEPSNEIIKANEDLIIDDNKDFIVLNKWPQIATQGGSKIKISIDHIIKNISSQYRLVHRLDKETSGLLLIAKNLNYAKKLSSLFKKKEITKLMRKNVISQIPIISAENEFIGLEISEDLSESSLSGVISNS